MIGIIGGTGADEVIESGESVKVFTPYGKHGEIIKGKVEGKTVFFLKRHDTGHVLPPHNVNYRANIWALKELGIKQVIAPCAVGSLKEKLKPGEFVIVDQFIDRTYRPQTFYEQGRVCHISVADPVCPELHRSVINSCKKLELNYHEKGTYVCIQGPRFSTRAESNLFRSWGADVIGMTMVPEAVLAREAELCYANVSMITDYDCWRQGAVTVTEVIKTMKKNSENLKALLKDLIPNLPKERKCACKDALKDALI